MTKVREILDIPERVEKGAFQITLTESVAHPTQTVEEYVVTPRLVDSFDRALGMITSALTSGSSSGTYLHGSFGSGKSHFMAMLSLLLANEEQAWAMPELHGLRAKYTWVGKRKPLELHLHMLGKPSIEAAIYPAYLDHLRRHHPEAILPGLFADEELFDDAAELLQTMGAELFLAPLNAVSGTAAAEIDSDFGDIAAAAVWTPSTFAAARSSSDPATRQRLLDALARTHFKSFRGHAVFVELEQGLHTISHHAKALGYELVVLFLDELILRLSMGASEPRWLTDMVQSMVKLVESQQSDRAIPVISFIARQKLLNEMIGDQLAGAENKQLNHVLGLAQGRFDTIELPNEDLPAIVERRVLRPRDAKAQAQIDAAFADIQRSAKSAWSTLTLDRYDPAAFRKLYPFSPALVEALITLSGALQRQRTAIKLLLELLVEHIGDLELGELVGVGDLFDLMTTVEEGSDSIMRERFRAAKQLYKRELLPLLQAEHKTETAERCQRQRPGHLERIGCSNCAERACRNDNRIVKTLLIAALTPSDGLRDLTASRLVQLNHGKLRTPIPGEEHKIVATKLRKWASRLGQIRVNDAADPSVSIELHGVDLRPILDMAGEYGSLGRREAELRRLLFEAMGVGSPEEYAVDKTVEWRNSRRVGQVRFGNVRTMGPDLLRCSDEHAWRLVVDFPFDEKGHTPREDEAVLEAYREHNAGSWTLVWLPSFFAESVNNQLRDLAILNHILDSGEATRGQYLQHLSLEHQETAITSMRNMQSQKRMQIREAMDKAYGIRTAGEHDELLDASRRIDKHLHSLQSGVDIQPSIAPDLSEALRRYVSALLDERYPQHPRFGNPLNPQTGKRIERMAQVFDQIVDVQDKRIQLDRREIEEVQGVLGVLGLVTTTETAVMLKRDGCIQDIERARIIANVEHPTVGQVGRWYDPEGKIGLQPEVRALVVRSYARATGRTLADEFKPGKPLREASLLERPDMPDESQWAAGHLAAGMIFGVALPGRSLQPDNLKRFATELNRAIDKVADSAARLPGALREWNRTLGIDESARLTTAESGERLVARLRGKTAADQVRELATFKAETSPAALGRSLGNVNDTLRVLDQSLTLGVFQQLVSARESVPGVANVCLEAVKALRQDEVNESLHLRLDQLARQGQELLKGASVPVPGPAPGLRVTGGAKPPTSKHQVVVERELSVQGSIEVVRVLSELLELAKGASGELALHGSVIITRGGDE